MKKIDLELVLVDWCKCNWSIGAIAIAIDLFSILTLDILGQCSHFDFVRNFKGEMYDKPLHKTAHESSQQPLLQTLTHKYHPWLPLIDLK